MDSKRMKPAVKKTMYLQAAAAYGYVALWITLSALVILYNKWMLTSFKFDYPIALTMWHMAFCSGLAFSLVKLGFVEPVSISRDMYLRAIVPIGALFAGTLWLGNAAYIFLSVSFIQMLKALMPVAVFLVGCTLGTEHYSGPTLLNMLIVSGGVAIASLGELNFVTVGVVLQLLSIMAESTRLTLVQILLQRKGIKLNPVSTLYYVAPCCFAFLCIPFVSIELPRIMRAENINLNPWVFVSNATAAFALNMSVFLLIGKTSALTMNVAGVVKDWLLIGMSALIFHSPVTQLNLFGYSIAFVAVCIYNYRKLTEAKLKALQVDKPDPPKIIAINGPPLGDLKA